MKIKIYINNAPYTVKENELYLYRPELKNEPVAIVRAILELINKMEISIFSMNITFVKELKELLNRHNIKCEYYINDDLTTFKQVERFFRRD